MLVLLVFRYQTRLNIKWASLMAQLVKESACNAGDPGSIPGLGRSPGEENGNLLQYSCLKNSMERKGNGNPLQCSCLENPRDERAWWAAVYGVVQSRTRLKRLSSSSCSRNLLIPRMMETVDLLSPWIGVAIYPFCFSPRFNTDWVSTLWQLFCWAEDLERKNREIRYIPGT